MHILTSVTLTPGAAFTILISFIRLNIVVALFALFAVLRQSTVNNTIIDKSIINNINSLKVLQKCKITF